MDMSDKNVHRGAQQWPKTAATTTPAAAATTINATISGGSINTGSEHGKSKHLHAPYDLTGVLSSSINPYGIGLGLAGSTGIGVAHIPEIVTHQHASSNTGYARFQPPPIHSHSHPVGVGTPPTGTTNLTHAPSAVTSNVPVFVPPAFSAAPTSVLTPNPFAVGSGNPSNVTPNPFSLDHQHLSKFMSAMNNAAAASLASTSNTVVGSVAATPYAPVTLLTNSPQTQTPIVAVAAPAAAVSPLASRAPVADVPCTSGSSAGSNNNSNNAGSITATIAENVLNAICANANPNAACLTPVHGRLLGMGVKVPDEEKMRRIQSVIEAGVSEHAKQQILQILDRISTLKPIEKLLLYLRLPGEAPETDPLRHPQNPLGTRSEINHTINWVRSHLEHDPQVSIPKQDVYNDYITYCERLEIKPLSTADFGKVMKQVFPGIRPRRLGTRGHSRYCYAAMRKTTKLTPPQLPQLNTAAATSGGGSSAGIDDANEDGTALPLGVAVGGIGNANADTDSWQTIKTWAETLLNVKLDNVGELAARIKTNNALGLGPLPTNMAKKYAQREPKEKRQQADMGPLKKRRKKKRKGSSSSESSQCTLPQGSGGGVGVGGSSSKDQLASPCGSVNANITSTLEQEQQEQKPIKMIKVKQEILDSPNYAHVQHMPAPTQVQTATLAETYLDATQLQQQQQQQQQQIMPMNLAPEQRTVSNKLPPTPSAAVKNLTPKIIEMANSSTTTIGAAPPSVSATTNSTGIAEPMPAIKEEIIDDYNPTNIICKKVRKAQQTKGFLTANSPSGGSAYPIITSTASSPPIATTVISSNATPPVAAPVVADAPSITYSMGPPSQMVSSSTNSSSGGGSANTTISPSASTLTPDGSGITPKVASRNWSQLRAKRLQMQHAAAVAAAAAAAAESGSTDLGGADKDADLPDSLGLPRERVISICNMDKHELDDYFLPGDEENSQDQDTELLQYFQTGDAEDKLNSLDATKLRTPTAAQLANITGIERKLAGASMIKHTAVPAVATMQDSGGSSFLAVDKNTIAGATGAEAPATAAVGSASASLTLMSQKHQQQQQQQQQQHQQHHHHQHQQHHQQEQIKQQQEAAQKQQTHQHQQQQQQQQQSQSQQQQQQQQHHQIGGNKRKISFDYAQRFAPARKNCIFMPISSPNISNSNGNNNNNINSHNHNASGGPNNGNSGNSGITSYGITNGCFASPSAGLTRLRPKPTFSKQQSLDCEDSSAGSDPMICANRRRRSYANFLPSSTSASAPPSPSVLQQQQRELFGTQAHFFGAPSSSGAGVSWALGNGGVSASNYGSQSSAALLVEQNSLDLELFGASGSCNYTQNAGLAIDADDCPLTAPPLTETQRSQSVPLSQLQRNHSPTFNRGIGGGSGAFQSTNATGGVPNYSACASVAPTPVPPEFGDATLFSENSNSQHSLAGHNGQVAANVAAVSDAIKLDETVVLASDSTAMLDDVDVSDILSSSDFMSKFSSIAQSSAATTTCSSSGSSSGYSSAGAGVSIFSGSSLGAANLGGGIISRSVPSTPLPHHHQNIFGSVGVYGRRRANDESHLLSPTGVGTGSTSMSMAFKACSKYGSVGSGGGGTGSGSGSGISSGVRFINDISKSMPTTPITTPCFRYSPSELNRDFLINGIDSITSFGAATGNDSLLDGSSDAVNMVGSAAASSADDIVDIGGALIDGNCGVDSEVFSGGGASDSEGIMVGADLLNNL